jgi:hypothetical protein
MYGLWAFLTFDFFQSLQSHFSSFLVKRVQEEYRKLNIQ